MDEVLSGIAVVIMVLCFILGLQQGVNHKEERIAESCVDFGKVKIDKKWYECKPIGN